MSAYTGDWPQCERCRSYLDMNGGCDHCFEQEMEAKRRKAAAKKLYQASLSDDIHCNRYPSFEELSYDEQSKWLKASQE